MFSKLIYDIVSYDIIIYLILCLDTSSTSFFYFTFFSVRLQLTDSVIDLIVFRIKYFENTFRHYTNDNSIWSQFEMKRVKWIIPRLWWKLGTSDSWFSLFSYKVVFLLDQHMTITENPHKIIVYFSHHIHGVKVINDTKQPNV